MSCRFFSLVAWMIVAWFAGASHAADEARAWELKNGDTVVFLGSAFTEQEIKYNHLETALSATWPDRKINFRNLGWTGDTPSAAARGHWTRAVELNPRHQLARANLQTLGVEA